MKKKTLEYFPKLKCNLWKISGEICLDHLVDFFGILPLHTGTLTFPFALKTPTEKVSGFTQEMISTDYPIISLKVPESF